VDLYGFEAISLANGAPMLTQCPPFWNSVDLIQIGVIENVLKQI